VDAAIVSAMRVVVDRVLMPDPEQVAALRQSAEPFLRGDFAEEPRRFLTFPAEDELAPDSTARFVRSLPGGVVFRRMISTSLAPDDPILIEHWAHEPARPSAVLIGLHGFTMGYSRIDATALMAKEWYRRGLDVALMTLPFHGPRTPPTSNFSGDRFARPDVSELNAAASRAIYEIMAAARWLRREVEAPVGLLGLSLGGYLAATAAGLDPDLDFVIPMVPPACFGDLAWRFFAASRSAHEAEEAALTYEELRAAYRVHSPLTYPLRISRERAMIIAGRGDRIVPPEHPHALWRHWGEPRIHWFSGSHLAPFGRRGIVEAVVAHLESIGVC
jgi:pimeloyl-ACP methyl ester carboxylesterase